MKVGVLPTIRPFRTAVWLAELGKDEELQILDDCIRSNVQRNVETVAQNLEER